MIRDLQEKLLREKGLGALTALGLLFFARPLFLGDVFFFRDLYLYYIPRKRLLADLLSRGEAPLWNPFLHGGSPFLGDVNPGVLYPTNFLYFLFEPFRALTIETVLHLLLAAALVYVLARVLDLGQPAAMLAGGFYAYSGVSLSGGNLYGRLLATPLLAAMVLAWHLYLQDGRRRWMAATISCGVLQIFAGAPEMIACSMIVLFVWTLGVSDRGILRRTLARWFVLGVAVGALAAVQLVPLVELVGQSQRGEGMSFEDFARWSVPPERLPEFVIPGFSGATDTMVDLDYWGLRVVDGGFPYFLSLYFGGVGFVLLFLGVGVGFGSGRGRLRLALGALTAFSLLLSLGRHLPGFEFLYEYVPLLNLFRYPVKFLTLTMLPAALLAAWGLEAAVSSRRRLGLALLGLLAAPTLWFAWTLHGPGSLDLQKAFFKLGNEHIAAELGAAFRQTLGVWIVAAALLIWPRLRGRPVQAYSLAVLVIVDLMLAGRAAAPLAPGELLSEEPRLATQVRETLGDGRLYRPRNPEDLALRFAFNAPSHDVYHLYRWNQETLAFYLGSSWDLPVIYHRDFNGLAHERLVLLSRSLETMPWEKRLPLLAAGSVGAVVTQEKLDLPGFERVETIDDPSGVPLFLYAYRDAAPRAALIRVWASVDDPQRALAALFAPGFDPRRHAVIEGGSDVRPEPGCDDPGSVETRVASARERRFTVRSRCRTLLVLSDPLYRGWEAVVDGERVEPLRANYAFAAVALTPGEHEVVWRYAPRSVRLGAAISAMSLLLLSWGFFRSRKPLSSDPRTSREQQPQNKDDHADTSFEPQASHRSQAS